MATRAERFSEEKMKKLVMLLIPAFLLFNLAGCGLLETSQQNEMADQTVYISGVTFQVPISWIKKVDNGEFLEFIEDSSKDEPTNSLTVLCNRGDLQKAGDDAWDSAQTAGKTGPKISDLERSELSIANMPAIKIRYLEEKEEKQSEAVLLLLQVNENVISFMFYLSNQPG